jgi:hypothetical protein
MMVVRHLRTIEREPSMTAALIVFLSVFFMAFVLVAVLGTLAWGIVSDRSNTASIADQRARLHSALHRRAPRAPARHRRARALDLGA